MIDENRRLGVYLVPWEDRGDGEPMRWDDIKGMALAAEGLGFDTFSLPDRLSLDGNGIWECTTMMAAIAAVTDRIRLGTAVTRSIYRHPALLAKVVASLDEISGGRYVFGIGAGSDRGDNRQFGYPEDHLYSRFEEAIRIVVELLRTGQSNFKGSYYEVDECVLAPRGPQPDGPSLMVAAMGPKMMKLAARYADSWNIPVAPIDPGAYSSHLAALDSACEAAGRDPSTLQKVAGVPVVIEAGAGHPMGEPISTDPSEAADQINRFFEFGFSEVTLWPWPHTTEAVEAQEATLAALRP